MILLYIIQELAKVVFYLSLPVILFALYYKEFKQVKERKNLVNSVADRLLELADDEKPIMLNISTDKLVDKVVDEIDRRHRVKGRFR